MCEEALAKVVTAPVRIDITGPGARSITLGGDGDVGRDDSLVVARLRDLGTQRRPWRDFDVTIEGDAELGAAVADNINII